MTTQNTRQMHLIAELATTNKGYTIKKMKNLDEDFDRSFATQVKELTDGEMSFGDFKIEEGYLISESKNKKTIIVLPEESLFKHCLFNDIGKEFGFDMNNTNFIIKKDEGDIDYLTRENNEKGTISLDGRYFKVFKQNPSAHGDAVSAFIVKTEKPIDYDNEKILKEKTKKRKKPRQ